MPRVFLSLCAANLICFIGAAFSGVLVARFGQDRHILLAVFGLILSCAIQVLAFTYFTVSGKVIAQAVHLGRLDAGLVTRVKELKRSLTHLLAAVVASAVLLVATGGNAWRVGGSHWDHYAAAGLALVVHVLAWMRQYALITEHSRLFAETLSQYNARKAPA
jgi:cell division protein FtsL